MSSGEGPEHDQDEYARIASGQHASMLWWFSMESPDEQRWRMNYWSYHSEMDLVDRLERRDRPGPYRPPKK